MMTMSWGRKVYLPRVQEKAPAPVGTMILRMNGAAKAPRSMSFVKVSRSSLD